MYIYVLTEVRRYPGILEIFVMFRDAFDRYKDLARHSSPLHYMLSCHDMGTHTDLALRPEEKAQVRAFDRSRVGSAPPESRQPGLRPPAYTLMTWAQHHGLAEAELLDDIRRHPPPLEEVDDIAAVLCDRGWKDALTVLYEVTGTPMSMESRMLLG